VSFTTLAPLRYLPEEGYRLVHLQLLDKSKFETRLIWNPPLRRNAKKRLKFVAVKSPTNQNLKAVNKKDCRGSPLVVIVM